MDQNVAELLEEKAHQEEKAKHDHKEENVLKELENIHEANVHNEEKAIHKEEHVIPNEENPFHKEELVVPKDEVEMLKEDAMSKDKVHLDTISKEKVHHDAMSKENVHLFGRQKPVHSALGGGKPADVILWRNKQISAALLAGSTVIWLLFEWIGYHLIPFICHFLILSLASLFLWSNLSFFVNKSPLVLPVIAIPENVCTTIALLLRERINQTVAMIRSVAYGKDVKKFLTAIFSLWIASIVGSLFDFLTIIYIIFVMILTMPPLYEKHEEKVDAYAFKAKAKLKRQYSTLDEKVLQKLPKVPFIADNKQA